MGKPLSEGAKQKIRDTFARKREVKETEKNNESLPVAGRNPISNVIYVPADDKEQIIEMGRQVQDGRIKRCGYATGFFLYTKI